MELTVRMCVIVAVGTFTASFMDSIAGGGGIISVPAYIFAGLPVHVALATNKFSSCVGTLTSTIRFVRKKMVSLRLGIPAVFFALVGSYFGTRLQLAIDDKYLNPMLIFVLPVVAFVVLRQKQLPETTSPMSEKKRLAIVCASVLAVGAYDGLYGPGAGTFFILAFCNLAKIDVRTSSGTAKLVNFSSGISAFVTSLFAGTVFLALGAIGAVASSLGSWTGAGLAIKNGSKIVRPTVIVVLILLAAKVAAEFVQK